MTQSCASLTSVGAQHVACALSFRAHVWAGGEPIGEPPTATEDAPTWTVMDGGAL